jgi:hypothetical protein
MWSLVVLRAIRPDCTRNADEPRFGADPHTGFEQCCGRMKSFRYNLGLRYAQRRTSLPLTSGRRASAGLFFGSGSGCRRETGLKRALRMDTTADPGPGDLPLEDEARALLRDCPGDGLEAWLADQRWRAALDRWMVEATRDGHAHQPSAGVAGTAA